jgi:putative sigma-54 modulation protein
MRLAGIPGAGGTERRMRGGVASGMKPDPDQTSASKLVLQAIHFDLTEAMEQVIRDKFAVLWRHNDYIVRVNVRIQRDQTMGTERHFTATGQIEIGGPDLIASAEGKEAYVVLDELVEKLDRLLSRRQSRRKDKRNHPEAPEIDAVLPKVE